MVSQRFHSPLYLHTPQYLLQCLWDRVNNGGRQTNRHPFVDQSHALLRTTSRLPSRDRSTVSLCTYNAYVKCPQHLSIATQTHTTQLSQGALHPSTSVLLLSPPKPPTLFTICLNLRPSRLICVHLHNHAQQRLHRNRQLIFCLYALDRIPSLASIRFAIYSLALMWS